MRTKKTYQKILDFKILQVVFGKDNDRFTTLGQFKTLKVVNQICLIGFFIYLLLFLGLICSEKIYSESEAQMFWIRGVIEFIPSMAELTSVFLGVVLGFYWEKADRIKSKNWDRLKIYRSVKKELENNIELIEKEKVRYRLLKSTLYEIYKEEIGEFVDEKNSILLTEIYWKIFKYNERVEDEPLKLNLGEKERDYIDTIIDELKKDINRWTENLTKAYKEYGIQF